MSKKTYKTFVENLQTILHRLEDGVLVGLLLLLISIAVLQILLRNLFDSGVLWGDFLVRILLLWIGLVGAMVASRQGNHINIDLVTRYLPSRVKCLVNFIVELFTAMLCGIVAYYSLMFVQMEFAYGDNAFAQVPVWICQIIIPFAFIVIALRYLLLSFTNITNFIKPQS
jgi:TRAP-type C4-dicarboxylate transport system permease small subunit